RGRAYNFGQDAPVAALEMVQTIVKLSRWPELTPDIQNTARNEIQDQYLSSELAHTRLGWRPQYSLQEGLRETIDWYYDFLEKESA
ncbi:MAG: sugar dehydratase, partial [Anaerolineales bacterium]